MDVASDDANGPENPGQWKTHPLYHTNFTNDKDGSPHAEEMLGAAHERRGLPYIQATKHRDEGAPVKQLFGLFGLLGILATLAPAAAASPGIAYDSVMKLATGSDAASAQPGTFEADFQTASQAVQQQPSRGGLLGGLNATIASGMAMANMMKNGMAERHYIAGARERTDNVAAQTATIL